MMWKVPYIDLGAQFRAQQEELTAAFTAVMEKGSFILRDELEQFETTMADYLGCRHVIGVNSGTDALNLAIHAAGIGPGDEVITVAHTFVATVASIIHAGSTPVFADIGDDFNMDPSCLETLITSRTRAIIPVHLNGRSCNMDILNDLASEHGLLVIEDAAQALGTRYKGKNAGTFGIAGCFSLHPMKTLGCAGDGGFIATDDPDMAGKLRLLRNHGQETKTDLVLFGFNSRLDTLQAALLNVKFKRLNDCIIRRRELARRYLSGLAGTPLILPPGSDLDSRYFDTYSSFVVRTDKRDALFQRLRSRGIEVFVHHGKSLCRHSGLSLPDPHLPVTDRISGEILSLPVYPEMSDQQVDYVISTTNDFFSEA